MYGVISVIAIFIAAGSLEQDDPNAFIYAGISILVAGWTAYKHLKQMKEMGFFSRSDY